MNVYDVSIEHKNRGIRALTGTVVADNGTQAVILVKESFIDSYCKRYRVDPDKISNDFWVGSVDKVTPIHEPTVLKISHLVTSAIEG